MPYSPHSEFSKLYKVYTSDPDSIGKHLTARMSEVTDDHPLLVVTGSDAVLFPGSGKPPVVESFRKSTRGFIELAGVSHLGTAVAWLVRRYCARTWLNSLGQYVRIAEPPVSRSAAASARSDPSKRMPANHRRANW